MYFAETVTAHSQYVQNQINNLVPTVAGLLLLTDEPVNTAQRFERLWTINGSGDLTALDLRVNSDPNCGPSGSTPVPCSWTTNRLQFDSINQATTAPSAGSCSPGPSCISSIAVGPANQFDPH